MRGGIDISAERSEVCLTDRYGNQIRAKGCENRFPVSSFVVSFKVLQKKLSLVRK
jgi:hypothetical protein